MLAPEVTGETPAGEHEALLERGKQAVEAARSLREDQTALMAEHAQSYRSMRRRAKRLAEQGDVPGQSHG